MPRYTLTTRQIVIAQFEVEAPDRAAAIEAADARHKGLVVLNRNRVGVDDMGIELSLESDVFLEWACEELTEELK
jgi:hypothetical protein